MPLSPKSVSCFTELASFPPSSLQSFCNYIYFALRCETKSAHLNPNQTLHCIFCALGGIFPQCFLLHHFHFNIQLPLPYLWHKAVKCLFSCWMFTQPLCLLVSWICTCLPCLWLLTTCCFNIIITCINNPFTNMHNDVIILSVQNVWETQTSLMQRGATNNSET